MYEVCLIWIKEQVDKKGGILSNETKKDENFCFASWKFRLTNHCFPLCLLTLILYDTLTFDSSDDIIESSANVCCLKLLTFRLNFFFHFTCMHGKRGQFFLISHFWSRRLGFVIELDHFTGSTNSITFLKSNFGYILFLAQVQRCREM